MPHLIRFALACALGLSPVFAGAQAPIAGKQSVISYGSLTPTQMHEDLTVLKRALIEIHPGLYRYSTPAEIDARFAAAQANSVSPASEAEFYRTLAQLVSTLKCGHTYLNPYNQRASLMASLFGQRTYLPLYFSVVDRRFVVTQNVSGQALAPGSEITRINGIPVPQIIDTLLSVTTADGNGTLGHRLNSIGLTGSDEYALFDLYFPLFYPLKESQFDIEAVDAKTEKPVSLTLPALTKQERASTLTARYGQPPSGEALWKYSALNSDTACLSLSSFVTFHTKSDYKKFLADAFAEIREKHIKFLVVDLRGNSGGDEAMGETVASYLTTKPIPCYDPKVRFVRTVKIDDDLFRYLDTYDDTLRPRIQVSLAPNHFNAAANGLYEVLDRPACVPTLPAAASFHGKTYVLGDAANASAAFQFLRAVQDNKLGTIVGQEGGGNRQGINGDSFFFLTLPNSHIEIDIPVFYEAPLTPQPDEAVKPDAVVPARIQDIQSHTDADMNAVMRLIAQSQSVKHDQKGRVSQSAAIAATAANVGRVPRSPVMPPP